MLVANPGQTPYSIISKKPCSNKAARNNATVSSSTRFIPPSSGTIAPSSSTVVSKTMTAVSAIPINEPNSIKTLSVRLTREGDLLKNTVQKTLPSKIPSHHVSTLNLYTVPPTSIHRYPERLETHSVDSLNSEMCHFKPIRTVPTTPAKRSKVATIKIPEAKVGVKEESIYNEEDRPKPRINLTESLDYSRPRASAFSLVALSSSIISQQHKTRDKSSHVYKKKSEQHLIIGKRCQVPTSDNDVRPSSVISLAHEQPIPPTSVKNRTRRNTKSLTSTQVVEQQNNKTNPQRDMRVTRKRQLQIEKNEAAPIKNAKLLKDCSKPLKNGRKQNANTGRLQPNRRTPPVTRSRLKQTMIHTRRHYQNK